jgi:hypothetical protein
MVERTRYRLVGLIEWLIAAGSVAALLAAAAAVFGDVRTVRPVIPVIAGAAATPIVPAGVRSGAISVPLLVLPDGLMLEVGAPASSLGPLGRSATSAFEQTATAQRETRTYHYAGMEFMVVIAHDRIVAIFR